MPLFRLKPLLVEEPVTLRSCKRGLFDCFVTWLCSTFIACVYREVLSLPLPILVIEELCLPVCRSVKYLHSAREPQATKYQVSFVEQQQGQLIVPGWQLMLFALLIFTVKETTANQGISVNMQKIHTPVAPRASPEAELCQSFQQLLSQSRSPNQALCWLF